jgi:outer membrane protein
MRPRRLCLRTAVTAAVFVGLHLSPAAASAESLLDAIHMAYEVSPALRADRAQLRATDETFVQARAAFGPQASLNGQVGYGDSNTSQPLGASTHAASRYDSGSSDAASFSVVQPVYTFGAARSRALDASANIAAGRAALRAAEAQLLLSVITAYMDVRRDREQLKILRDEISIVSEECVEIKARAELGDLTTTDVIQAQERLVAAKLLLIAAEGQLHASNAAYLSLVGQEPGELETPPDLPGFPANADEAFVAANRDNPDVVGAIEAERSARAQVKEAEGAFGPTVSLRFDADVMPTQTYDFGLYQKDVSVSAVLSLPLYASGLNASKVRAALENDNRADLNIADVRLTVTKAVATFWDAYAASSSAIRLGQEEVKLQQAAVEGYREEVKVSVRTTLDVLNAEVELATVQVQLARARHDEYVARASVLSAVGRLELRFLEPGSTVYDPAASFAHVRDRYAPPWLAVTDAIDAVSPAGNIPSAAAHETSSAPPPHAAVLTPQPSSDEQAAPSQR